MNHKCDQRYKREDSRPEQELAVRPFHRRGKEFRDFSLMKPSCSSVPRKDSWSTASHKKSNDARSRIHSIQPFLICERCPLEVVTVAIRAVEIHRVIPP